MIGILLDDGRTIADYFEQIIEGTPCGSQCYVVVATTKLLERERAVPWLSRRNKHLEVSAETVIGKIVPFSRLMDFSEQELITWLSRSCPSVVRTAVQMMA